MLIGLLSDTHIAWPEQKLPPQVLDAFKGVDLILHAGDIWVSSVLDELESVAPVLAAQGDDDMEADIGNDSRVIRMLTLEYEGLSIWVKHVKPSYGFINPAANSSSYTALFNRQKLAEENGDPPDVVVFGHSHFAEIENYKGTLLVNPGSPTMPSYLPKLGTVGFLKINEGTAEANIVQLT